MKAHNCCIEGEKKEKRGRGFPPVLPSVTRAHRDTCFFPDLPSGDRLLILQVSSARNSGVFIRQDSRVPTLQQLGERKCGTGCHLVLRQLTGQGRTLSVISKDLAVGGQKIGRRWPTRLLHWAAGLRSLISWFATMMQVVCNLGKRLCK